MPEFTSQKELFKYLWDNFPKIDVLTGEKNKTLFTP